MVQKVRRLYLIKRKLKPKYLSRNRTWELDFRNARVYSRKDYGLRSLIYMRKFFNDDSLYLNGATLAEDDE